MATSVGAAVGMMSATLRGIVSKKKKRYQKDGFDLDLTYIYENIIAMGFPAEKLEGVYRNNIEDVIRFLDSKHKDRYKIYNLCVERQYDAQKFHDRVALYTFEDHNPPKFDIIRPFCQDVEDWLNQHEENVAVVHCKAGKGRTGVMICSYMLHKGLTTSPELALRHYGELRTHDKKGVTIPSQQRYVEYYGELVKKNLEYKEVTLSLTSINLNSIPNFNGGPCSPCFAIYQEKRLVYSSRMLDLKKGAKFLHYEIEERPLVFGDIRVEFYNKTKMMKKEKMFQFWFNSFFASLHEHQRRGSMSSQHNANNSSKANGCCMENVALAPGWANQYRQPDSFSENSILNSCTDDVNNGISSLSFSKDELDKANKDKTHKHFSEDFRVLLTFCKVSGTTHRHLQKQQPSSPENDPLQPLDANSDNCSSQGEGNSDNELLDTDTDTDTEDDDIEGGCQSSHV